MERNDTQTPREDQAPEWKMADILKWQRMLRDAPLSDEAKLVGFILSTHANGNGESFPSIRTIAREAGKTERSVIKGLRELQEKGYIAVEKSKGRKRAKYILTAPEMLSEDNAKMLPPDNVVTRQHKNVAPGQHCQGTTLPSDNEMLSSDNGMLSGDNLKIPNKGTQESVYINGSQHTTVSEETTSEETPPEERGYCPPAEVWEASPQTYDKEGTRRYIESLGKQNWSIPQDVRERIKKRLRLEGN